MEKLWQRAIGLYHLYCKPIHTYLGVIPIELTGTYSQACIRE